MLVPLMGKQAQSSIKILILFINHCAKILTPPPPPNMVSDPVWKEQLGCNFCQLTCVTMVSVSPVLNVSSPLSRSPLKSYNPRACIAYNEIKSTGWQHVGRLIKISVVLVITKNIKTSTVDEKRQSRCYLWHC